MSAAKDGRVIITGGSGLIGRALTAALANAGHEVVVLSRTPERARGLPAGTRPERWDGQSAEGWGKLVDGAMAVVNLAGENIAAGPWSPARKKQLRDSRLGAGRAVVQAVEVAERRPSIVIQASAVGYYGTRVDQDVVETAPPGSDFLARLCVDWEASTKRVEDLGVRRAIVRSGVVLSPDGGALPRILMPFRFFVGGPLGDGRQPFPWIHLADEVGAIRFLIDNAGAVGPFNLTAPDPPTNAEFGRALGRAIGRPSLLPTPAPVLRLVFGEMATVLLDGQRAVPRHLIELGFVHRYTDCESALRSLLR